MKLVLVPRTQLSVRLSQRSTLVAKSLGRMPSNVLGSSPIIVTAGGLTYTVSLDLAALVASLNAYYLPISAAREKLTAARTYYVRVDGSDSNTGLVDSAGGAFRTIQACYDNICANLDLAGKTVTIQVRDGTFTGAINLAQPWTGGGVVNFTGNTGTPGNCVISVTSNHAFKISTPLPTATALINGFKLSTTTSGDCLRLEAPGVKVFLGTAIEFGACAGAHIHTIAPGAIVQASGYTINGNAARHWNAQFMSVMRMDGTITLTGTPAFSAAFATAADVSLLFVGGITFSGSATGTRFTVDGNSVINVTGSSATYLPGNAAGVATNGGQYF